MRGWVGFVEAASLDWLEHRALARGQLRDMLVAALDGALSAAAGTDPRVAAPAGAVAVTPRGPGPAGDGPPEHSGALRVGA